jgi:sigma-54 dependent transcriptional regulator, acetoin dehydrogenase operon transcriptional activator AcoR
VSASTITAEAFGTEASRGSGRLAARLVFVANAEDLRTTTSSHALDDLDEVRFGRGPRGAERKRRTLTLSFPDGRMSSEHGALQLQGGRWILEDLRSKNGAIVDGAAVRSAVLVDGSVFELGYSCFVFRQTKLERELPPHLAGDVLAEQLPAWPAGMATFSPGLAWVYDDLLRLASRAVSIVIGGETGTGKELVARAVHTRSARPGAFVAVNCGALAPTLIESELFGHRRGAFSGAVADRRGLVRAADKGTLFLDEIGELPLAAQATLLRVLQEREVLPVGEDRPVAVDLRVVAATLRDLDQRIAAGGFRDDLYARLAGHVVALPALRERREDLGLLLAALLPRTANVRFTPAALRTLLRHDWPRNIRELEQCLSTAGALAPGGVIDRDHLPAGIRNPRAAAATPEVVDGVEVGELDEDDRVLRDRLVALFAAHEGNVAAVAAALGKQRQQVYKWVKRLAIDLSAYRR